jgi:hypothetical protein
LIYTVIINFNFYNYMNNSHSECISSKVIRITFSSSFILSFGTIKKYYIEIIDYSESMKQIYFSSELLPERNLILKENFFF